MNNDKIYSSNSSEFELSQFKKSDNILVNALDGFSNAGNAISIIGDYILDTLPHEEIVKFNSDKLFNYRLNRSFLSFDDNRFQEYYSPEIKLYSVKDNSGKNFFLLKGSEPDLKWEKFSNAILYLTKEYNINKFITLNSFPMNVPHTRPTIITAHGTDLDYLVGYNLWNEKIQVPGNINGILELNLSKNNIPIFGLSAQIPHYLSQMDYPPASYALLESISLLENINISLSDLENDTKTILDNIKEQLFLNPEFKLLVESLEEQYDNFQDKKLQNTSLLSRGQKIPTGDELGAELEKYLAKNDENPNENKDFFGN